MTLKKLEGVTFFIETSAKWWGWSKTQLPDICSWPADECAALMESWLEVVNSCKSMTQITFFRPHILRVCLVISVSETLCHYMTNWLAFFFNKLINEPRVPGVKRTILAIWMNYRYLVYAKGFFIVSTKHGRKASTEKRGWKMSFLISWVL
jgi:hypothetical protein